jgi:sulfur-oxidizing protein SoxY
LGTTTFVGLLAMLSPLRGFARMQTAFDARKPQEALDSLLGGSLVEKSERIKVTAADMVENGAVVPVLVEIDLPGVESLSLLAPENPRPLALTIRPGPRVTGPIAFRIRLAKSQDITVLVRANGKNYSASRRIRIVFGGCIGT